MNSPNDLGKDGLCEHADQKILMQRCAAAICYTWQYIAAKSGKKID